MTNDFQAEIQTEDFLEEDDFMSVAECHTLAAEQFQAAAKQHMQAADAYSAGNFYEAHRRAYLAYRHQLVATQYAEMAALSEDEEDSDIDMEDLSQA